MRTDKVIIVSESKTGGTRIYPSRDSRERGVAQLKAQGYNYFVSFRDTQGCGLQYATASWVPKGKIHHGR